jgi:hypothetical protein
MIKIVRNQGGWIIVHAGAVSIIALLAIPCMFLGVIDYFIPLWVVCIFLFVAFNLGSKPQNVMIRKYMNKMRDDIRKHGDTNNKNADPLKLEFAKKSLEKFEQEYDNNGNALSRFDPIMANSSNEERVKRFQWYKKKIKDLEGRKYGWGKREAEEMQKKLNTLILIWDEKTGTRTRHGYF